MGWRFRKSINLGPLRITLSKTGVGFSVGGPGYRTGVGADGRKRTWLNIPGTGISYTTSSKSGASAIGWILLVIAIAVLLARFFG